MNKYLLGIVALCVLPMSAFAEGNLSTFDDRVPLSEKLLREYKTENPNVSYGKKKDTPVNVVINEYKMEAPKNVRVSRWYMGLNGDLSFLTWKNKNSGTDELGNPISGEDKFNFKPVLGADLVVGYRFDKDWRVDGEFGYIGKFFETETEQYLSPEKTEFSLETYYIDANAYYDLKYGLYVGAGAGLAIVNLAVDHTNYSKVSKTNLSPMGAVMFGWSYALDEKVDFDVRYRLALFNGGDLSIGGASVDTGLIMNNSLSVGVRYHF